MKMALCSLCWYRKEHAFMKGPKKCKPGRLMMTFWMGFFRVHHSYNFL